MPVDISFEDRRGRTGEQSFYRIMAEGRGAGRLVSNPVFVRFR
jgi:hypothetical protein